jgi:hypothetical protein
MRSYFTLIRTTCPAHLILLDLVILIRIGTPFLYLFLVVKLAPAVVETWSLEPIDTLTL